MPSPHIPKIVDLRDGRWEIECSECQRAPRDAVPLGVFMRLCNEVEAATSKRITVVSVPAACPNCREVPRSDGKQ